MTPIPARIPENEEQRLAALHRSNLLDTAPERVFDDFTALAAHICSAPIALISLVDRDRQWFKSNIGLDCTQTPRDHAFCAHAILESDILEVPDACSDARFATNPIVLGDPFIRFYAGAPLKSPDGYPLGTLCVIDREPRTLTEAQRLALRALARQVETQLALRATLQQLDEAHRNLANEQQFTHGLLESMLEGLMILTLEGEIEQVNPAAEAMFGYRRHEVIGQPLSRFVAAKGSAGGSIVDSALGRVSEWQGARRGGVEFPLEAQVWRFGPPEHHRLGCHIRDLSRQREAERVKNRFVGTVSHELRTPLTSIRGSLGLLMENSESIDADSRELIELAHRNTNRLMRLVNDILDFERLSAGGLSMEIRPNALATILERALDVVRAVADEAGVRLSTARTSSMVNADADRMVQVLVNLLANAIKYTPNGGEVRLTAEPAPPMMRVRIEDDGPGVPESYREAIFEPFKQVEGSAEHRKGGTGLGLSISRAIVREHGGEIGAGARLDGKRGAAFSLTLPLA